MGLKAGKPSCLSFVIISLPGEAEFEALVCPFGELSGFGMRSVRPPLELSVGAGFEGDCDYFVDSAQRGRHHIMSLQMSLAPLAVKQAAHWIWHQQCWLICELRRLVEVDSWKELPELRRALCDL
jgi:hypothetical protein